MEGIDLCSVLLLEIITRNGHLVARGPDEEQRVADWRPLARYTREMKESVCSPEETVSTVWRVSPDFRYVARSDRHSRPREWRSGFGDYAPAGEWSVTDVFSIAHLLGMEGEESMA